METIIFIVLLVGSLIYNMKQYKTIQKCKGCEQKPKPSKYKQSWKDGGKAKSKW